MFIYALDADEPGKQVVAQNLFNRLIQSTEPTVLVWQVVGELLANLRKREAKGRISGEDVEAHFNDFLKCFHSFFPIPSHCLYTLSSEKNLAFPIGTQCYLQSVKLPV